MYNSQQDIKEKLPLEEPVMGSMNIVVEIVMLRLVGLEGSIIPHFLDNLK